MNQPFLLRWSAAFEVRARSRHRARAAREDAWRTPGRITAGSLVRLVLVVSLFMAGTDVALAAQVTARSADKPGNAQFHSTIESDVARAIAARWGAQAASVQLEVVSGEWPAEANGFRLLGDGVDGNWAVVLESTGDRIIVRAGVLTRVLKAARDLERATVLVDADMNADVDVIWGPPARNEPVIEAGWLTKRRVRMGEPLRPPVVEAPRAVRPGDVVSLVVERGSVTITLSGRAAGSAAIGERVAVRADTGRRMEGVVIEPGVVRIGSAGDRR